MSAVSAGIGRTRGKAMEGRKVQAFSTRVPQSVANVHYMREAGIVSREAIEELADRKGLHLAGVVIWLAAGKTTGHRNSPMPIFLSYIPRCVKGINPYSFAEQGETVVITQNNTPIVKFLYIGPKKRPI